MNALRSATLRSLALAASLVASPLVLGQANPDRKPDVAPVAADVAERGLVLRTDGAVDGLTLIAPLNSNDIYLVGMDGEVAHQWKTGHARGSTYFMENGDVLHCGREEENPRFRGGGIAGRIQRHSWDGELVWDYLFAGDERTQHHDIEPLPNGNVLLIAWEHKTPTEALARGRDPRAVGDKGFWPDAVFEVRPTPPSGGEIVWEWHSWDHLIQDFDPDKGGYGSVPDHPERIDINADHRDSPPLTAAQRKRLDELEERMKGLGYIGGADDDDGEDDTEDADDAKRRKNPDWLHTNAIAYHPELDLIALSTPHMSEVWVIDHSTTTEEAAGSKGGRWGHGGDLLWRWGNPSKYGAGKKKDRRLFYQHDPTWIPGDGLRLLVFNNGSGRDGDYSEVLELELPFDAAHGFTRADGQAFGPAEAAWTHGEPGGFYAPFISGAQRLPGGNTLVCSGPDGRVFEVTRDGEIVWDFLNPLGGEVEPTEQAGRAPKKALFRATRIPAGHSGLR